MTGMFFLSKNNLAGVGFAWYIRRSYLLAGWSFLHEAGGSHDHPSGEIYNWRFLAVKCVAELSWQMNNKQNHTSFKVLGDTE